MLKHARPRGRIGRIVASGTRWCPSPAPPINDADGAHRPDRAQDEAHADRSSPHRQRLLQHQRASATYYKALLSLGDRRIAPAIELAEENGGQWRKALADSGIDGDFYIYRDRSADAMLPWDIIDGGMKEPFFRSEFEKSTRAEWTLPPKRAKENARLLPVLS